MVADKSYMEQLVNKIAKTILDAIENLSIEDINMYQLGYDKAKSEFDEERVSLIREIHDKVQQQAFEQGRANELDKISKMMLTGCDELKCSDCPYEQYSQDVCQQAFTIGLIENYINEQLTEERA